MGCLVARLDTGFRMSNVQSPRSIHSPLSFILLSRGGSADGPDFFERARSGAWRFTRETSHDVSNNIRGEKSILAILSKNIVWQSWKLLNIREMGATTFFGYLRVQD